MVSDLKPITHIRSVYYLPYANFPTNNIITGDLAFATDRLVLYRWSGSAWQSITIYSSSGLAANIPDAAILPNGSLYFETNTNKLKQIQGDAWVQITNTTVAKIVYGSYSGDSTINRAIPHGLNAVPTWIFITDADNTYWYRLKNGTLFYAGSGAFNNHGVTVENATNFYVGYNGNYLESANATGRNYVWIAIKGE